MNNTQRLIKQRKREKNRHQNSKLRFQMFRRFVRCSSAFGVPLCACSSMYPPCTQANQPAPVCSVLFLPTLSVPTSSRFLRSAHTQLTTTRRANRQVSRQTGAGSSLSLLSHSRLLFVRSFDRSLSLAPLLCSALSAGLDSLLLLLLLRLRLLMLCNAL